MMQWISIRKLRSETLDSAVVGDICALTDEELGCSFFVSGPLLVADCGF